MKNASSRKTKSNAPDMHRSPDSGNDQGAIAPRKKSHRSENGQEQALEALRESEAILRSFFDSSGVMRGIIELVGDDDLRYISTNAAFAEYLGSTPQDMNGRIASELGEPYDLQRRWIGHYLESRARREPIAFEYFDQRGEHEAWLLATISFLDTSPGGIPHFAFVILDITERKRAEAALHESEERVRFALETSRTGAWDLNLTDHTSRRSIDHDKIFGYPEVLPVWTYEMFLDHVLPEDRKAVDEKFRLAVETGGDWNFECRIRRRDGAIRWIWAAGRHRNGDSGAPARMAGIVQDITERKQTEEALRESEQRLTLAQKAANAGTWDWNVTNGKIVWSPGMYEIFGLKPADAPASFDTWNSILHPDDRSGADSRIRRSLADHSGLDSEYRILRPDGEVRWINALGEGVYNDAGQAVRMYGICLDITDRKLSEQALSKAHEKLEVRVKERTTELNTAIASLDTERHRLFDVLETLPVYVCLLDLDFRMPFANRYFRETFAEPKGRRCYEFLFNRTEPCEICESYTVMKTRAPHHWFWTGPNGRDYDIYDFPFIDSDGSFMILEMGIDITERKRAEEDLANLASIVEHSDDAIIGKSLDGIIRSWNRGAGKIYGYSAEEAIGRHISMLVPPGLEDNLTEILDRVRNGEPVFQYDSVRIRKDGTPVQVFLTVSPIKDHKGTLIGASTIARDITDRKKAEDAIERANAYNRSLIETSLDPLVTINPDGTISDVNEATIRVTGFSREHLIGTDFSDYFTKPAKAKAGYEKVFRDGSVTDYELEIRHRNGHVTPVLYNAAVYRDSSGNVSGVFASARDITDRKLSELAIERANAYNRSLIEASLDPLVTINPDGTISDVNEATIRFTGHSREHLIGTDFSDYFTEPAKAKAGYEKVFRDGSVTDYELEIRHRNGHVTPVLYNAAVYRDSAGNVIGVFAAARDITERKKAEEALKQGHALLEVRVKERTAELAKINEALKVVIEERKRVETSLRETSQYLENLINFANAPIIVWDPQFRITLFNQAFEHLTGWKASEMIGKTPDLLLPGNCKADVMDLIRETVDGELWESVEIPILQKTGKIRTVLWNSAPILDDSGTRIVSVIAQGQDITERKQIEREKRQRALEQEKMNLQLKEEISQRRLAESMVKKTISELHAAIESTADGIYVVDRAGKIVRFNQNFASMWEIPAELLLSSEDSEVAGYLGTLVKKPDLFNNSKDKHVFRQDRETFDMLELKNGRIFERYSKPQKMDGKIIGRVQSFRDVTDRRRAEENLLASLAEKETLIREIHHRVKNNLQVISGLLDMTRMRTTDSRTNSILTDMMMKIKTMAQIHTRLYESKQFDRINMGGQIRDQVTDLSTIYGHSGAEILTEIDTEDFFLPVDQAIPCALVVNEILSNAYKHAFKGKKHGNLNIYASSGDGRIRIVVRDDGVGIPDGMDVYKTTSLGLKLIRSLVQQLNGSATIDGKRGTEVTVEFPLVQEAVKNV